MGTQTGPTTLYALAETAIATLVNGAANILAGNALSASAMIWYAPVATTAPGTSGSLPPNKITLQGSQDASDNTTWNDIASVSGGTTAAANTTANGSISAAATTATLTGSATFSARSGLIYLRDSSTVGEWIYGSQATTTLTVPAPGIINSHLTGINLYDQAARFALSGIDVSCFKRLRLRIDNNQQSTGPTIAVFATYETYG